MAHNCCGAIVEFAVIQEKDHVKFHKQAFWKQV